MLGNNQGRDNNQGQDRAITRDGTDMRGRACREGVVELRGEEEARGVDGDAEV